VFAAPLLCYNYPASTGRRSVDLTNELEIAKTIARMAASICQEIQVELVGAADKAGHEPVTIADYASQAIIGNALAENFPDDGVISEERSEEFMLLLDDAQRALVQRYVTDAIGGYVFEEQICAWLDFGKRSPAARQWIVDPIDGTKGFLAGEHYCVAIALLVEGEPRLGVLASPGFYAGMESPTGDRGALTYARWGAGAYSEALFGGLPAPIHVSSATNPQQAVLLSSRAAEHQDARLLAGVAAALRRPPDAPQRHLDSQDKHALIAAGLADIYLRLAPDPAYREKLWDHAAGTLIVQEAGGRVSDLRGQPLEWTAGPRMIHNTGVLVTNRLLHDTVLSAIAKTGLL